MEWKVILRYIGDLAIDYGATVVAALALLAVVVVAAAGVLVDIRYLIVLLLCILTAELIKWL